jgi:hypothetical protein
MTAQGNPGPWGKRVEGLIVAKMASWSSVYP